MITRFKLDEKKPHKSGQKEGETSVDVQTLDYFACRAEILDVIVGDDTCTTGETKFTDFDAKMMLR